MLLRFATSERVGKIRPRHKLMAGFVLISAVVLGWTYAGNINVITGGAVTFGQGVAQTISCDDNVVLTPRSTYSTESGFLFSGVEISSLDSTSAGCQGKQLTLKAYSDGSGTPLTTILINDNGSSFDTPHGSVTFQNEGTTTSSVNYSFASPSVNSSEVTRITIETSDQQYGIGKIGPGGGTIFYDAGSQQSWGRYIEAAPADWNGRDGDAVNTAWCSNPFLDVNSDSTGIGNSIANTNRMLSPYCDSGIAYKARAYHGGGKTDWSVPSLEDMREMSMRADIVHGLINESNVSGPHGYWVSNGGTGSESWIGTVFEIPIGQGGVNKMAAGPYMRPVRYF